MHKRPTRCHIQLLVRLTETERLQQPKSHLRHQKTLRRNQTRLKQIPPQKQLHHCDPHQKRQQTLGSNGLQRTKGTIVAIQFGAKEEKKEEDPQAGIMNMMKKMYEEGD
jgi:hypothetical protein